MTILSWLRPSQGFFPFNYHPAILYLGDTGASFIGFMISVLSLQGLKNATAVAVVTPMIILGTDYRYLLAIIRRTPIWLKNFINRIAITTTSPSALETRHTEDSTPVYGISMIFSFNFSTAQCF